MSDTERKQDDVKAIPEIRREIDRIDSELLRLLGERRKRSVEAAKAKEIEPDWFRDRAREEQLLIQNPDFPTRHLQYLIPGGIDEWAALTYTAPPRTFDRYRPLFEASASATEGAKDPKLVDSERAGTLALYGAGIAKAEYARLQ